MKTTIEGIIEEIEGDETITRDDILAMLKDHKKEAQKLFEETVLPIDKLIDPKKEIRMTKRNFAEDFNLEINRLKEELLGKETT